MGGRRAHVSTSQCTSRICWSGSPLQPPLPTRVVALRPHKGIHPVGWRGYVCPAWERAAPAGSLAGVTYHHIGWAWRPVHRDRPRHRVLPGSGFLPELRSVTLVTVHVAAHGPRRGSRTFASDGTISRPRPTGGSRRQGVKSRQHPRPLALAGAAALRFRRLRCRRGR